MLLCVVQVYYSLICLHKEGVRDGVLFFKTRRFIDLTLYFMGDELWKKQLKNL